MAFNIAAGELSVPPCPARVRAIALNRVIGREPSAVSKELSAGRTVVFPAQLERGARPGRAGRRRRQPSSPARCSWATRTSWPISTRREQAPRAPAQSRPHPGRHVGGTLALIAQGRERWHHERDRRQRVARGRACVPLSLADGHPLYDHAPRRGPGRQRRPDQRGWGPRRADRPRPGSAGRVRRQLVGRRAGEDRAQRPRHHRAGSATRIIRVSRGRRTARCQRDSTQTVSAVPSGYSCDKVGVFWTARRWMRGAGGGGQVLIGGTFQWRRPGVERLGRLTWRSTRPASTRALLRAASAARSPPVGPRSTEACRMAG